MKYTLTLAALVGAVTAAHDGAFAVLRFNGKEITRARLDPLVNPGEPAQHVHGVMGGSAFAADSTGESMAKSKCTNAKVLEDRSAYWFPWLYFQDPKTKKFEAVDINYVNVYYFFDKTNDDIKAFPRGLGIIGGNASTRIAPVTHGDLQLDPTKKDPIQAVQWTCPRDGNNFDSPPSWPSNSDGSSAGERDSHNKGAGTGFPDVHCDGRYSPLRADIHMPSCYNPKEGLTNTKTNMVYPSPNGNHGVDCPPGYIHVPHMFYEIYWDTPQFKDRWAGGQGSQPFVLSTGDVTGYSSHADFLAAWDESALQNVIDNCKAGHEGIHSCSGVTENNDNTCKVEGVSILNEVVDGVLSVLPGNRPLEGWSHGVGNGASDSDSDDLPIQQAPEQNGDDKAPAPVFSEVKEEAPAPTPAQSPKEEAPAPAPEPETTSCVKNIKTVWETLTVTATATEIMDGPEPTADKRRRHVHQHAFRHRSLRK